MKLRYTKPAVVGLKELGGFPMTPPLYLTGMTLVELVEKIDPAMFGQYNTDKWWYVRVKSGPYVERLGYLPKNVLIDSASALHDTDIKYGMVPNGDVTVWQAYCVHCGEAPSAHEVPETTGGALKQTTASTVAVAKDMTLYGGGTKEQAAQLLSALGTAGIKAFQQGKEQKIGSSLFEKDGLMIGVLHVQGGAQPWASHSNNARSEVFASVAQRLGFRYAPPIAKDLEIWTRAFERATDVENPSDLRGPRKLHGFDYQCAAPRLIQAAVHACEWPLAMSEIWFGPKSEGHGHTIPSCNRCRPRVPFMLCPSRRQS